ncbi:MAG: class I SAM-dependent methyltransferase [Patescibacteria group bacterium]|nr:class I SAM-dependent methyltransferase [Patescibacteria group bacterium]
MRKQIKIRPMTTNEEQYLLVKTALKMTEVEDKPNYVELGVMGCWTSRAVTEALEKTGKDYNYYGVDKDRRCTTPWKEHIKDNGKNVLFLDNTYDASHHFPKKSIHWCFIDANHQYKGVRMDIKTWLPKMNHNCFLIFHDIATYTGSKKKEYGVLKALLKSWEVLFNAGYKIYAIIEGGSKNNWSMKNGKAKPIQRPSGGLLVLSKGMELEDSNPYLGAASLTI